MKFTLKSAGVIAAMTTTIVLIINPCLSRLGSNLILAGATGLMIYLICLTVYNVAGELAANKEIPLTVDRMILYDNVIPLNRNELFHYSPTSDIYEFVYIHPTIGLFVEDLTPEEKENIEIHYNKDKLAISKTSYIYNDPFWAFFANCPLPPDWDLYLSCGEKDINLIDKIDSKEEIGDKEEIDC